MAQYYGLKIKNNLITLEKVPPLWLPSVTKWLQQNNVWID